MKIYSIEVVTDQGRRVAEFSAPFDVDPVGAMPAVFRSFPELLWSIVQQTTVHGPELAAAAPKAEA